jgi:hypothetical protein
MFHFTNVVKYTSDLSLTVDMAFHGAEEILINVEGNGQ